MKPVIIGNATLYRGRTETREAIRMNAKAQQVGGGNYKDCAIQPAEYATANGFGYCESLALRYITRHKKKNGRQDIEKAIHCLQLLIEMEYPEAPRHQPNKPCC